MSILKESHTQINSSAKTVLVVEDEVACAMSLQLILQYYGCKVIWASACDEALKILTNNQKGIDLILLDIMMPGKTGIDFLVEAKEKNILSSIPIVIQSSEDREIIRNALDKGAYGYVSKPYIKSEILSLITKLLKCNLNKVLNDMKVRERASFEVYMNKE